MNILFAKSTFAGPISGADEIITTYAEELKKAGYRTSVLLVHSPAENDSQVARLEAAGVPVSVLASPSFSRSLALGRKLALRLMRTFYPASRLIREISRRLVFNLIQRYHADCCEFLVKQSPDVVHVMTPDPGAVMLIRAAHTVGIPVVYQEVGIPFHPPGFEEVYERLASVLGLCSEVATLSPRLAREVSLLFPHLKPPQVLPLISDDRSLELVRSESQANGICFGFAARLEHLKGPVLLVEAFDRAGRARPHISLKIAGDGSQRELLLAMIDRLNLKKKSQLVGTYRNAHERSLFMRSISVFVLPSLTEGTPNAIIEAMAHGKPIIATDVGGIADIVTEEIGVLVPPGDAKALADAMAQLAGNLELCRSMGIAARKKYEQLFTSPVVLPVLTEFYEKVIGNGHAKARRHATESRRLEHPWFLESQPECESSHPTAL